MGEEPLYAALPGLDCLSGLEKLSIGRIGARLVRRVLACVSCDRVAI